MNTVHTCRLRTSRKHCINNINGKLLMAKTRLSLSRSIKSLSSITVETNSYDSCNIPLERNLLMSSILPHYLTSDYELLFGSSQSYLVKPDIKDKLRCFLEIITENKEGLNEIKRSVLNAESSKCQKAKWVQKSMNKGGFVLVAEVADGKLFGISTSLGWISDVSYLIDKNCLGFIMDSG